MPIRELRCTACGDVTERVLKFSDPDPTHCQLCYAELEPCPARTLNFSLHGTGWGKQGNDQ